MGYPLIKKVGASAGGPPGCALLEINRGAKDLSNVPKHRPRREVAISDPI